MKRPFNAPDEFVVGFFKSTQSLWQGFAKAAVAPGAAPASPDEAALEALSRRAQRLGLLQLDYLEKQTALWASAFGGTPAKAPAVVATDAGDRRFSAAEWRDNPTYSLLKQCYLLNARLIGDVVEAVDLEPRAKRRLRFYARQFVDLASPANFVATNPDVAKLAVETQGESLRTGLANLIADLDKGGVSITDETAFEVGRNVAVSKGAVVFENELFQLIQYAPLTETVASRPLVIVPPCINKFYILDLQPENSFVRFAVEAGLTVFVVSWRNPDASCDDLTWEDYVAIGAMKAIDLALVISQADKVNAIGWCVGGTILSCALAILRVHGDDRIASVTLLTTLLDYEDPGDLGVFVDEQGVVQREQTIGRRGIYPGAELAFVFQTLRANDLIWPNVINNYLKGKSPPPFDLLYWNADVTNLSGPMYAYYLRNMYLENNLRIPGRLTLCGTPVDLRRVDMPSYILGTQEDHIVPWCSAYRSTQLFGGPSQFVLGASGHIAGVVNPAKKNKRKFWIDGPLDGDAEDWLAGAREAPGSWWSHWLNWLNANRGESVPARVKLGAAGFPEVEAAPGRYVKARAK